MDEEKKDVKVRRSITLDPINDTWLEEKAFKESTPGNPVSVSELINRLVSQDRESELKSPSEKKRARAVSAAQITLVA